jgi:DMSO reductase anchor subunit
MHPAPSIIFFTTLSGTGYGLLAIIGLLEPVLGIAPADPGARYAAMLLAFGLIGGGLLCSTMHLQHPMRAWRGFSQWRSSWLSREAVLALATFLPALPFAWGWAVEGQAGGVWAVLGIAAALLALATLFCTGMIYGSLKTVPAWRHPMTAPLYVLFGLATGAVWAYAVLAPWGDRGSATVVGIAAVCLLGVSWGVKVAQWMSLADAPPAATAASATGLEQSIGPGGYVRHLIPPHTQETWLLREMTWQVGRKHARKLRFISVLAGLAVPAMLLATAMAQTAALAFTLGLAGAAAAQLGVTIERWLFFAEAKHAVSLYYGADAV